ncbi:MAG TPA: DUF6803 family protein [Anaerolineaceae bacterium]
MTHYMELLVNNQPWNLIIFMAIPVILAEFIAVTELYILFSRNTNGTVKKLNRTASIIVGLYFTGIFIYLFTNAFIPLTTGGGGRGFADVIAVSFYLLGIVPLLGMALLEIGVISRNNTEQQKLRLHATFVAFFLVVAHIAMIFGMVNPMVLA